MNYKARIGLDLLRRFYYGRLFFEFSAFVLFGHVPFFYGASFFGSVLFVRGCVSLGCLPFSFREPIAFFGLAYFFFGKTARRTVIAARSSTPAIGKSTHDFPSGMSTTNSRIRNTAITTSQYPTPRARST